MIYLLDVNVLLAMHYITHVHHNRTERWLDDLRRCEEMVRFATCSVTELGFVRIAGNKNTDLAQDVTAARRDLERLKETWSFSFITDPLGAAHLPSWVERPPHVTDGHLLALATALGARLVTLDSGIPGALLIPGLPNGPTMVRESSTPYSVETRYGSRVN